MINDSRIATDVKVQGSRAAHVRQNLKSTDIKEVWVDDFGIDESIELTYVERQSIVRRQVGKQGDTSYHLEAYLSEGPKSYWSASKDSVRAKSIAVVDGAADLLEAKLKSKSWRGDVITLSGNVDCYHPVERKVKNTRRLLEVFLKYKHPVRLVTKSTLILRDMDILAELAKHSLVEVCVPVATLHKDLQSALEPTGAALQRRMQMVKMLSAKGIPVSMSVSPIVPGLNDEGIFTLVKVAAAHGATAVLPTVHHLGGSEAADFKQWARRHFPYRWRRVIRSVEEKHRAVLLLSDSNERKQKIQRMVSDIFQQFQMAANAYGMQLTSRELNSHLYNGTAAPQMSFF